MIKNAIDSVCGGPHQRPSTHIPLSPEVEPYAYLKITAYFAADGFRPGIATGERPAYFMPAGEGLRLDGPLLEQNPERGRFDGVSGYAFPAAIDLIPLPFGQWQGTYSRIGISVPSALIAGTDAMLRVDDDKLVVEDSAGVVGTTRFWLDHWSPRAPLGGATPCGTICAVPPRADQGWTRRKRRQALLGRQALLVAPRTRI